MQMEVGTWLYSKEHQQGGLLVEKQELWGQTSLQVWLPSLNAIVRIREEQVCTLEDAASSTSDKLFYIVAAARIADTLAQNILLAPIEASVIPLPHQLNALARATAGERIRYLLADEVGLGKTIEAGLIIRELKLRGLVKRILVVAPKSLVTQWVAEMYTHFSEEFHLVLPGDFTTIHEERLWTMYDQVVCPMDTVKPLDKRRGWQREQIAAYNYARFESLITANWDLVIVDEAHRLSGSSDQVARYRLGQGLAETTPYLLLLSATPHQGKSDAFRRLLALLEPDAFPDLTSIKKEHVQPYLIRTEKRHAIDAQGLPLFQPRQTRLVPILWKEQHREQRMLYEAVTEYVREGYNQAIKERKNYIGFLMTLMQRLVTSSTRAISTTLSRRLELLQSTEEQAGTQMLWTKEDWADLDGQEQVDAIFLSQVSALKNERREVERLLHIARNAEQAGPDVKAEYLLEWIYHLQQEEANPVLKILIFTEFVPTQAMLHTFLDERGFVAAVLNGSMGLEERKQAQDAFAAEAQILISTDAGGEGLNLQFAHIVINYDIPWNPMRLEQRIGRVDRIGQTHPVRALNFALEDTVEYRVREVLETKLDLILKEFGFDKAGDVLDSVQTGPLFDHLFLETILHPGNVQEHVETFVNQVHEQIRAVHETENILQMDERLDHAEAQKVIEHPLSHWIERMVVTYLRSHEGSARLQDKGWELKWPDGATNRQVVFSASDAERHSAALHLTLEDQRIRTIATQLPTFIAGQPIPRITLSELPAGVEGTWSLWQISITADDWQKQRVMPLFIHRDGRILHPTARYLWDRFLVDDITLHGQCSGQEAHALFEHSLQVAMQQGETLYTTLRTAHQARLLQERRKKNASFTARRRAITRIGLVAVKTSRLSQLDREEQIWREQSERYAIAHPDMHPLLVVYVAGERAET